MEVGVKTALISSATAIIILLLTHLLQKRNKKDDIDEEEQERLRMEAEEQAAIKNKKDEAMYMAMAGLLRSNMIDNHDKYMVKGYITVHGLENWEKMYHPYKGLGGNGMVDSLNEDIRELKVKNDDEESK